VLDLEDGLPIKENRDNVVDLIR